jgi:hypothetical protein
MAEFISLVRKLGLVPVLNGVRLSAALRPQSYDPLHNVVLSTLCGATGGGAAFGTLAIVRVKAHVGAAGPGHRARGRGRDLRHARADGAGPAVYGVAYDLFPSAGSS